MWDSYKDQVSTIVGIYQDNVIGHAAKHRTRWKIHIRGADGSFNARSAREVRQTLAANGATEIVMRYAVIDCHRSRVLAARHQAGDS